MDEVDYMSDADFDTVTTIAAERNDIGIMIFILYKDTKTYLNRKYKK